MVKKESNPNNLKTRGATSRESTSLTRVGKIGWNGLMEKREKIYTKSKCVEERTIFSDRRTASNGSMIKVSQSIFCSFFFFFALAFQINFQFNVQ